MPRTRRFLRSVSALVLLALVVLFAVPAAAQGAPDLTKFGYKVAKTMDINPDQTVTLTDGDQSVLIKPGTFDNPVTFDLLTSDPAMWKDVVKDRTVRAGFAFRVTDKTTKALVGMLKVPAVYTYSGKDATATDAIYNTPPASPPTASLNAAPPTFMDGKLMHPFGGAGVGWLVVSAPTAGTTGAAPAAAAANTPAVSTASAAATTAPATTATRPAATTAPATTATRPVATGTGGGIALPQTGAPHSANPGTSLLLFGALASVMLVAGGLLLRRTRHAG